MWNSQPEFIVCILALIPFDLMIIQLPEYELVSDRQSILPVKSARPVACSALPQLVAPRWLSWWAHMVLWMELLMGAPHPASTVDLWVAAGVRERVFACFLAGWGDRWLSPLTTGIRPCARCHATSDRA